MTRLQNHSKHALLAAGFALWLHGVQATAQVPPAGAVTAPPPAQVSAPPPLRSLLYSPDEVTAIHRAVAIYIRHANPAAQAEGLEEDFLQQLDTGDKQGQAEKTFTYPQFFLESLVYHTAEDWSVRVNGLVIQAQAVSDKAALRVLDIDPDKVRLEWQPATSDRLDWGAPKTPGVQLDHSHGVIDFTLRPNQTFSSYAMRVVEGKITPMTIENTPADLNTPDAGAPDSAAVPATSSKAGLDGLIGSYQNLDKEKKTP